ncbi:hypothetical protein ZIOFF_063220 [Zingiber officinale]|uniref:BAG domain-containing protein n=1 Tax=Zingiber officinale TaxID=94328 RepID=A0A8J5F1W8_ZINOF|nr:hypothetical protein ZIOFF_063220 [Zingiber officinale]
MEGVVQLPEDSAGMTVGNGHGSTEVAGMELLLQNVMAESERLQGLVATLCEWNTEQCRLMTGLADRVENLLRTVQRMENRTKGTKRPLFFVADPRSPPDCYPGQTNQFPESAATRAPEPEPAARPRVVSIPVHFGRSNVAAKPVDPIRLKTSKSGAAIAIQRVFRGHLVRTNIKLLSQATFEVGEIEGRIHANKAQLRVDLKERLQMNEMLMAQLLRLDSIRWVREYRRKVIRKEIALQEFLDGISVQSVESPNSVNSQATAEKNSNDVDSSDMSIDIVSNTISQDTICAVSEDVSQKSKDPILAEKKSDANVLDEGFKAQDPLA